MQVLSCRTVEASLAGQMVDLDSGLSAAAIEPKGDVGACGLDQGGGHRVGYVLLYDFGEIINFSEEDYPAVVGCVVVADLFWGIVSLFRWLYWKVGFQIIFVWLAHIKLYQCFHEFLFNFIEHMKVSSTAKMVPSLFYQNNQESDIFKAEVKNQKELLRPIENFQSSILNRKKQRKHRAHKNFIQTEEQQPKEQKIHKEAEIVNSNKQNNRSIITPITDEIAQQVQNTPQVLIRQKPKLLLDLQFDQQSDEEQEKAPTEINTFQTKTEQNKPEQQQLTINFNRLHLLDWSNSSDNAEQQIKIVQFDKIQEQRVIKQQKQIPYFQDSLITIQKIFQQIPLNTTLQCLIRRDKKNSNGITQYNVYLQHNLKHILTIRKQGIWKYCFYLRQTKPGPSFLYTKVGTLWSTFFGNNFTFLKNNQTNSQLTVCYETNILGINGPRKINVYIPKKVIPFDYLHQYYQEPQWKDDIIKCVSRSAKWNEQVKSYVLSFKGRATESSIKNFVITDVNEMDDNYFIIFGKAGPDVYNLDISYPFNLIQGISVAITSFERKITCD